LANYRGLGNAAYIAGISFIGHFPVVPYYIPANVGTNVDASMRMLANLSSHDVQQPTRIGDSEP